MSISDDIAALNHDRYQQFVTNETGAAEKAVIECNALSASSPPLSPSSSSTDSSPFKVTSFVFDGPAYRGFDACTFTPVQYEHAQQVMFPSICFLTSFIYLLNYFFVT